MGDLKSLIARWRAEPRIGGNVTAWQEQPAILGTYAELPANIEPRLAQAFAQLGYKQLYSHQRQSWDLLREGKNVAVVAGTASGKTLCYNLPVLDALLKDPQGRALYLFPTKALANDQSNSLNAWLTAIGSGPELVAAVYDGDTPASSRTQIRSKGRIILSNPDMLHIGVLPYHTRWAELFANLRYVVLDEMHIYRGVFGSHQANVLRRLQRLCAFYGSYPQFIFASATISNAKQLAEKLIEQPVELVEKDGAPHGSRTFLVYNPPVVNKDLGIRASVLQETVQLASEILTQNVQTIVFGRTRRMIELMLTNLRAASDQTPAQIRGYRSGYLKGERREIEKGLRSGEVRVVVATTALELGVDIGGLDAAVLAGYPGTIAATRQQAGRAGRSDKHALVVMLMQSNPLEQFLARHPEYFLLGSPEQALINPNNLLILLSHIRCAAFELPFKEGDSFGTVDGEQVKDFLEVLVGQGQIHQSGGKYFWMSEKYPALEVSLRGTGAGSVVLQSHEDGEWKLIGDVDPVGAHSLVHPEAIYIHEGRTYFVDELNLEENIARMHPVEVDYYTVPVHKVTIELVEKKEEAPIAGGLKQFGQLLISDQVHRYERIHWTSNEAPGGADLDLPPITLNTFGYWFSIDQKTTDLLRERGLWLNDPNDYGENWPQQKLLVRARDQYRCQNCGATEDGRVHDVHHRTPFRTFRNHKEANQIENLITLCPACHRQAETVVKVRSGLAGLSFVLSHLAPLFIMCDPHNIGVSSDPKSDLAEGEPAIVIYDNVPDGIGLSQRLYEIHDELMLRAHEIVAACECADGCPACVGPGGEQGESSKKETLALLELLAKKGSPL